MIKTTSALLLSLVLALALGLAGCSPADTTGQASVTDAAGAVPNVDRDPQGRLPTIVFDDAGIPVMAPVASAPPEVISVQTLQAGDGNVVAAGDHVTVDYAGFLWSDATQFDSSYDTGTSVSFSLNQVIAGWRYGLAGSKVGDRVLVVIPPDYGYGDEDADAIPGGSTLVFVVDILDTMTVSTDALAAATPTQAALPEGITIEGELGQEPTLTLAGDTQAPAESEVIVVAEGAGPVIAETDSLLYHVVGGYWGEETSSTWSDTYQQADGGGGVETIGTRVGSRILLVYPPDEDSGEPAYVLVVDLLAAVPTV